MFLNTTKRIALSFLSIVSLGMTQQAAAQCSVPLNNNKAITFNFSPIAMVTNNCGQSWGYNYDFKINYTIKVTGTVQNWYYIGVKFDAGVSNTFTFGVTPSQIANGSGSVTTGNLQSRYITDCTTATPASLNVRNLRVSISSSDGSTNDYALNCNFANVSNTNNQNSQLGLNTTPLPVKLVSFDAAINNNKVDLAWVTATETDNAYFILERSNDAQTWEDLTKMDGAGTSRYNTTYNYTDEMPQSGMNYYRLKQVDANGTATYSRILAVKAADKQNAIALYPNPNNGENIHFTGMENAADWSIKVVNTSSAVVYQAASITEQVSLPSLQAGMYFVQLHNNVTGATQLLKLMRK